jgi:hypothetical protein
MIGIVMVCLTLLVLVEKGSLSPALGGIALSLALAIPIVLYILRRGKQIKTEKRVVTAAVVVRRVIFFYVVALAVGVERAFRAGWPIEYKIGVSTSIVVISYFVFLYTRITSRTLPAPNKTDQGHS